MISRNFIIYLSIALAITTPCLTMEAESKPPLHALGQDTFHVAANQMTFKELLNFSLVDKEALQKVKSYFEWRKNTLINIECPILMKEQVLQIIDIIKKT